MKKFTITSFALMAITTLFLWLSGCTPDNNTNNNVVPNAPTGLSANAISSSQVNLNWTDNATNETGYKVQRKNSSGNFIEVGSTGVDINTYSDLLLIANTTYTYRVYAYNTTGNSLQYSNEITIITPSGGGGTVGGNISDIDGNTYPTVQINNQIWTAKNLNVTRYRNGDPIPQITDPVQWGLTSSGAWCWYNNDSASYAAIYGKLYNWYAVNDARGLAPNGWHIPTNSEWAKMTKFLDPTVDTSANGYTGENIAIYLKSTTGWNELGNGTNFSGFNAFPAGVRKINGQFMNAGNNVYWWTANEISGNAWFRFLGFNSSGVYRYYDNKRDGYSVRCVKN
jgi:uncharacterized protein (TIGR02145 family)